MQIFSVAIHHSFQVNKINNFPTDDNIGNDVANIWPMASISARTLSVGKRHMIPTTNEDTAHINNTLFNLKPIIQR